MDVIDAIANTETGSRKGMSDVPLQAITIESMSLVKNYGPMTGPALDHAKINLVGEWPVLLKWLQ